MLAGSPLPATRFPDNASVPQPETRRLLMVTAHGPRAVRVAWRAVAAFFRSRAPEVAAAMAYYAFFSLFPLVLLLVAIGSRWLQSAEAQALVLNLVGQSMPLSRSFVEENLVKVLSRSGSMGALGVAGLLWSGLGFFSTLVFNVNRAWHRHVPRGALLRNLVALLMTVAAVALLAAGLLLTTLAEVVLEILPSLPRLSALIGSLPLLPAGRVLSWLVTLILLYGIYRWAPDRNVSWRAALPAALVAAALLEATKLLFTWYVGSRLVRYDLLYGGLEAIATLLLWVYIGSSILLFGVHLSASIAHGSLAPAGKDPIL